MAWSNSWNTSKPVEATPQINPKPSAFPEWDKESRENVLIEWDNRKKLLEQVKADEMEFRKYVVNRAFPNPTEGVNTLELNNGYELKAGIKFNYKLDPDNIKVEQALDKLAATGNEGAFIADRLVSWKANLSLSEYRELAPQYKRIIDEVVTIDEAAPTLEIKAPRGGKK